MYLFCQFNGYSNEEKASNALKSYIKSSIMPQKKLVQQIDPKTIRLTQPILTSQFLTKFKDQSSRLTYELYENFILEKSSSSVRIIHLTFQLLFELLRKNQNGVRGEPYGIAFELELEEFSLFSSNVNELLQWRKVLSQKLNQKNFHNVYKPIKKIGKGNFATVYLATRLDDNKKFAVKAISKQNCSSQFHGRAAIKNEVQIMRLLNHVGLLQLFEVYESEVSIYLCVQFINEGQLLDLVRSKNKIDYNGIKHIIRSLLTALDHMHAKRFIHRDLKPQNILIRNKQELECVIADFGLATWVDQERYLFVKCGTPGYVAPQIANAKDRDQKFEPVCDVFSLGAVLHFLLFGKPPFIGLSGRQILQNNKKCQIQFQKQQYKRLPQNLLDLLKKMLQKKPEDRITVREALKHKYFSQEIIVLNLQSAFEFEAINYQKIINNGLASSRLSVRMNGMKFRMQENIFTGKQETVHGGTNTRISGLVSASKQSKFSRVQKLKKLSPIPKPILNEVS